MSNYRNAFLMALAGNLLLAGILSAIWWHSGSTAEMPGPRSADAVLSAMAADPALAPIPLPRRGFRGRRSASARSRASRCTTRSARRETWWWMRGGPSYVQLRFSGWIRKVFIGATFQYIQEGSPLFTIYSPDLVSTEQEYLLARQNQKTLAPDSHGMAAQESGWLLDAAEERLRQFGVPATVVTSLEQTGKVAARDRDRLARIGIHHRTQRTAQRLRSARHQALHHRRSLDGVGLRQCLSGRGGPLEARRSGTGHGRRVSGPRAFNGRVDQILPEVDPATRTVRVRLIFRNPGCGAQARHVCERRHQRPAGKAARRFLRPRSAVRFTQPLHSSITVTAISKPREIQTGPQIDDSVMVLKGLQPGRSRRKLGQLPGGFRGSVASGAGIVHSAAAKCNLLRGAVDRHLARSPSKSRSR